MASQAASRLNGIFGTGKRVRWWAMPAYTVLFLAVGGPLWLGAACGVGLQPAMLAAVGLLALSVGAAVLIRQLRGRIEAERQADETEATFRSYFDHFGDGLLVLRVEPDGRFVYEEVNAAAEAMFGWPADRAIGWRPSEMWPGEGGQLNEDRMRECVAEGRPIRYSKTVELPRGMRRLQVTVAPVRDPGGRIHRLASSVLDVTERDEMEEKLRHAHKMEAVGRLTAGIAHDFNNLLQTQSGSLELLLDELHDHPAAREYAEIAIRSTDRGAQLTHHLLAFARKQVLQPEHLDMAEFLPEIGHVLGRTIGPHIEIVLQCAEQAPAAFVDPGQIEAALLNLAINAADAMPVHGRLQIDAYAALHDTPDAPAGLPEGSYVVVALSDTGTGMDSRTLEHACEPFFTTKGVSGSGLGLSMVQGFARQSGGELRIASEPGKGTRAELWLPCIGVEPVAAPVIAGLRQENAGRVLLVDDAPEVLMTTGAILESAGFEVVRAESGDRALVVLAAGERFDAMVTDYAMPGLNGAELIRQALHLQPDLRALIITGFAEISGLENLPKQVQVLRKPFRRSRLVRQLRHLVTSGKVALV